MQQANASCLFKMTLDGCGPVPSTEADVIELHVLLDGDISGEKDQNPEEMSN